MSADTFYVIFKINEQSFCVSLSDVVRIVRIVRITPIPELSDIVEGVINVQGEVIPVVNLRKRFGINERGLNLDNHIILINASTRVLGLLVDEVTDIVKSQEKDLIQKKEILPGTHKIQGVMKNEKDMILIQDLDALLSLDEEKKLETSLTKREKTKK